MKKIIIFSIFLVIFINVFSIKAYASDYNINSVVFDVILTEEGHAEITENWNITYSEKLNNSFEGKLIYKLPKEEKYSQATEFSAYIDGKSCEYTHTKNEEQNLKYNYEQTNKSFNYSVFFPSQNQTRDITIKYTLEDIVKQVNDKYFIFAYRFFPKGFNEHVNLLTINIKTESPQVKELKPAFSQAHSITRADNVISMQDYDIDDIYKVKIKMTGDIFKGLKNSCKITMLDSPILDFVKNMPLTKSIILLYLYLIFALISTLFLTYIFFLSKKELKIEERIITPRMYLFILIPFVSVIICAYIYNETKKEINIKKDVTSNPDVINEMAKKWQFQNFSLIQVLTRFTQNQYLSFFMHLPPLLENKTIGFSTSYRNIIFPKKLSQQTDKYTLTIIEILNTIRKYSEVILELHVETSSDFWVLPIETIDKYFGDYNSYKYITDKLNEIPETFKDADKKELMQDITLVKRMLKYVPWKNVTFEDLMFNYLNDTRNPNIFNMLFFVMQNKETIKSTELLSKDSFDISYISVNNYEKYIEHEETKNEK